DDRQLDAGLGDADADALATVVDLEDVPPFGCDQLEELDELARPVRDAAAEDEVAAGARQLVADDGCEERRVDVPAGEERADVGPARARLQQGGDGGGGRPFDDELRPLEQ